MCSRKLICADVTTPRSVSGRTMLTSSFAKLSIAFAGLALVVRGAAPEPRVFGPSQPQEIYRVLLDRDALLLESISAVIKQKGITDGQVLITAGSVQECTY